MKRFILIALIFSCFLGCSPTFRKLVKNDIAIRKTKKLKYLKAYKHVRQWENMLYTASFPLLKEAAPFVKEKRYSGGFVLYDSVEYTGYHGIDNAKGGLVYDVTTVPKVQFAHPLFSAYNAGLRQGDQILSVDGSETNKKTAKEVMASIDDAGSDGHLVYLSVLRDGKTLDVDYKGEAISDFQIELLYTKSVISFANGKAIRISKGMMDSVDHAYMISYIISYEIASNMLNQLWMKTGQISVGAVADILTLYATGIPTLGIFGKASEGFRAKDFVYDADFIGLYLLKSLGYSIEGVPSFWKDMDERFPKKSALDLFYYPPSPEERYQELMKSVQEVEFQWKGMHGNA